MSASQTFVREDYFCPYDRDLAKRAHVVKRIGSGSSGTVFQVILLYGGVLIGIDAIARRSKDFL